METHTLQVVALGSGALTTGIMLASKTYKRYRAFFAVHSLLSCANATFLIGNARGRM